MKKLTLNRLGEKKIQKGYCVLEPAYCTLPSYQDCLVGIHSASGRFLGTGYLSSQNKGIGWLISPKRIDLNQAFFQDLFQVARQKRSEYEESETTTVYRVFNQDGDGFGGFTVDCYGSYAVFSWYNSYVFSIKEMIMTAFQHIFPEIVGAYEKIRFKGLDYETAFLYGQEAPESFLVLENGVSYQVFLNDGLMTGIFLDQHEVRKSLVDGLARGKTLLNMFSYTAAFSVAAVMGGAKQTVSVDLAKRSRELSEAHFHANELILDNHRFVVMDVFDYFKYAKRHQLRFDVIVIDPPSFARNKKQTFSVAKDYHKLVHQALEILEPNGQMLLSTNASTMTVDKFKKEIDKGMAGTSYQILETYRLPSDFVYNKNDESSNYLKVFTIQVTR